MQCLRLHLHIKSSQISEDVQRNVMKWFPSALLVCYVILDLSIIMEPRIHLI